MSKKKPRLTGWQTAKLRDALSDIPPPMSPYLFDTPVKRCKTCVMTTVNEEYSDGDCYVLTLQCIKCDNTQTTTVNCGES